MTFDVRPYWMIGALCGSVFGLLVLIVRRGYPDYLRRALEFLGAANLCLGASYLGRYFGPWLGRFVPEILSPTMVVACLSLEYLAVCKLKKRASSPAWSIGPPLLIFLLSSWFAFGQRNITIQLLFFNAINMVMMFLLAVTLSRQQDGRRQPVDVLTAISYSMLV